MSSKKPNCSNIKTTCAYCGVGCGIEASVDKNTHTVRVQGDKEHPANWGKLCSKGSSLGETLNLSGRLLQPNIHGDNVSWDCALDAVATGFKDIIDQYGADSVAFYGSGQLLTEDYYVANKLMKGFIGSANIDTNSRLCMASSVAGYKRAFGSDTVPCCYEDIEQAELIVLIGSNAAWCHPVTFARIRAAKEKNPRLKIVVIDPRRTDSCDIADLHLAIAPGSDVTLFNGLLNFLADNKQLNSDYIHTYTEGFNEALASAKSDAKDLDKLSTRCGLNRAELEIFYQLFSETEKTISLYSQGINQSSSGVDKVNAIINCHLATGRVGKIGAGPFSITGQPNAMGGREVGGLANQLAAHMDFNNPNDIDRVARFWQTDTLAEKPGLPAVQLFDAIDSGKIKAVWIMATNPVVSLPNADKVKRALKKCPLVVVSDCVANSDTLELAHIKLPAAGWSEKDGTVTNSERRISRQRALLPRAGEAKPDWWIISQVAQRMGFFESFNFNAPVEIFREHAALSAFENTGINKRDFDLSNLQDISDQDYRELQPVQWPVSKDYPNGRARFFDDNRFYTASKKANFIAVMTRKPENLPSNEYPFILNTGRLRDQWHTMTRTAEAARLNQHRPEPFVEIHSQDADTQQLNNAELATITSQWGAMTARVRITDAQQPSQIYVPMHWTSQYSSHGRMGALVNPALDPISQQPESKHTPVNIVASPYQHYGFILIRNDIEHKPFNTDYWVKVPCEGYQRLEIACNKEVINWADWIQSHFFYSDLQWQEYEDSALGVYRCAAYKNNRLQCVINISHTTKEPELSARNWLGSLFSSQELKKSDRLSLLSGLPSAGIEDVGNIVCACFNVGEKTILKNIEKNTLTSHQQVGEHCKAGTNCGSCVPEIKSLLNSYKN